LTDLKEKTIFKTMKKTRDKPPKARHLYLLHILILVLFMQVFPFMFIQRCIVFVIAIPLDSDSLATRLH
jgi:hypothetical protein